MNDVTDVSLDYQDDGRTLKVFLRETPEAIAARVARQNAAFEALRVLEDKCGARPPFGSKHCIRETGHHGEHVSGATDSTWHQDFSAYRLHDLDDVAREFGIEEKK